MQCLNVRKQKVQIIRVQGKFPLKSFIISRVQMSTNKGELKGK